MNAVEIYEKASWDVEHNKITLGEFEERIKSLYDVEPVRHGRWIADLTNPYGMRYICSECGVGRQFKSDFCPNCGAKMDVKEQEHDRENAET